MIVICLEINKYRCLPIGMPVACHITTCELVEQEIQKPHSMYHRLCTDSFGPRSKPGIVGTDLNVWSNMDIQ